ncbi:hypothetical protein CI109_101301 [Kwoniella shandongensis]|uniref:Uncharacterized protein n=1 Tax=Kwoniella shandongensis TaxID=1734106 RepID=A0A5M6BU42_9TREE|nr:uncharacterized protein CI109_005321 [Kwoniella shandongensis]KAA5526364.1 hypothetical protein CI109_005321 [Kwoniella shandongensis]
MLTKASAHFRPFIRIPASQPDHFTANPSLLHHLPHNGSSNALVSQAQNSTQTAGSSGSTGRAGYGGNAGAGGNGYTGHARAFISLPQTSAVDPSSTLSTDEKNQVSTSPPRSNLLLKHRLSKRTRIIGPSDGTGREVRREIEARAGSSKVSVLEIEGVEEADWKEDRSIRSGRRGRRSSIAFPTQAGIQPLTSTLGEASSSRSRLSSPTRGQNALPLSRSSRPTRGSLTRSQTTLEIWQVGIPSTRAQLGVRSLSTRSDAQQLLEREEDARPLVTPASIPSTRVIGQPNRVLMDLAGRDVPGKRLGLVRRNSTAAVERASLDEPPVELLLQQKSSNNVRTKEEKAIISAILDARENEDIDLINRLVSHYRSPRSVSPFDQNQIAGDPELSQRYPLPATFSLEVYNACLNALVFARRNGQTIAPILEIYNEILERDLIPDSITYGFVIRALALRAKEVSDASKIWSREKKWGVWRSTFVGPETWDAKQAAERDQLYQSYEAEGNLSSALKLFRAATIVAGPASRFNLSVYGTLLEAMSRQEEPDVEGVVQIYRQAEQQKLTGLIAIDKYLFKALGAAKDAQGLESAWSAFVEKNNSSSVLKEWAASLYRATQMGETERAERINGLVTETWHIAIEAFIAAGEPARAFELFGEMTAQTEAESVTKPVPAATHKTCGRLLVALAEAGELDLAFEWNEKIKSSGFLAKVPPHRLTLEHITGLVDAALFDGRYLEATDIMTSVLADIGELNTRAARVTVERRVWRLYTALVGKASEASESAETTKYLQGIDNLFAKSTIPIPLDVALVQRHLAVLARLKRFDDMPSVLNAAKTSQTSERGLTELAQILKTCSTLDIPVGPLVSLVHSFTQHGIIVPNKVAEVVVQRFQDARSTVSSGKELQITADAWFALLECFAAAPAARIEEGEFDDALLALTSDLAEVKAGQSDFLAQMENHTVIVQVVRQLVHRFGVERSSHLLTPLFGEEVAKTMTAPAVNHTSPSSPASATSEFSDPSSTGTASTAPTSVDHNLTLDRQLTAAVERFTARNPPITPIQAYELVRAGLTRNAVPYPETICRLIDHLARLGDEPKVRELYSLAQVVLSSLIRPEAQARNWHLVEDAMLIACCHLGHLEQAGMHRARIVEAGLAPSADAYATMIASSKDTTDDALVARELFEESQAMGVKPHLYLYNTIISKLSKARKAEVALELFLRMKEEGIRPSSVTYGAVINACCRVGDAQSAETLFEEMASQPNFRARVPPFNTMMQFYLQTQPNRDRVLHYYNALRRAQVPPSAHTYKLLLDAYATLQPIDLESMERVFAELVADRSVNVQGTHWASLITAHGIYANDLSRALEIFDSAPSREAVVWEAMLNVLSQRGTIEELETMRKRMIDSGAQPTAYVYNVLINGYARGGNIERAREIFDSMGDSITGVAAPNNHPTLLTSSGHVKPNTMTNNPTGVVYREPSTYEAMIRAEVRAGSREAAEEVLRRMEERGYPLAVFMRGRQALDEGASAGTN